MKSEKEFIDSVFEKYNAKKKEIERRNRLSKTICLYSGLAACLCAVIFGYSRLYPMLDDSSDFSEAEISKNQILYTADDKSESNDSYIANENINSDKLNSNDKINADKALPPDGTDKSAVNGNSSETTGMNANASPSTGEYAYENSSTSANASTDETGDASASAYAGENENKSLEAEVNSYAAAPSLAISSASRLNGSEPNASIPENGCADDDMVSNSFDNDDGGISENGNTSDDPDSDGCKTVKSSAPSMLIQNRKETIIEAEDFTLSVFFGKDVEVNGEGDIRDIIYDSEKIGKIYLNEIPEISVTEENYAGENVSYGVCTVNGSENYYILRMEKNEFLILLSEAFFSKEEVLDAAESVQ